MSFARILSFAVSLLAAAGLWIMAAGTGEPVFLSLPLFLAAAGLFAARPLRKALGADAFCLAPCLPVLSPFAQGGAAGLALAALLAGFGVLLSELRLDAFPCRPGRPAFGQGRRKRGTLAARRLVSLALLVFYGGAAFFSPLSAAFCLAAFALFLLVCALSLWASGGSAAGARRRFSPVRIISRGDFEFGFAWAMLPFALAALALAFVGFARPAGRDELPGLFAALSPLLFVLPSLVLWGRRGERAEVDEAFFSRDDVARKRKSRSA